MISVLRMGHRKGRDKRITTHVGLVARAFGADEILITTKDEAIEGTLNDVTDRFGGEFRVKTGVRWRRFLKDWKGTIVHLTMYGEHVDEVMDRIPKEEDLIVVVGSEKVPGDLYKIATFNVAVGNQPHSEVAALAVFLDKYLQGKGLKKDFRGKFVIKPSKRGKEVVEVGE